MAQEAATTALVYDARGAVAGAKEFEAASEKVRAANRNAAAASDTLTAASDRLQKAQDAVSKAAERVQKAQETAARAAERFGSQSEQAAQAAERVARATETASRAQDRLSRAQEAAVVATERLAIGLGNQERRIGALERQYIPASAAAQKLAQTKEYLNSVIARGGQNMERAQSILAKITEDEKKAALAAQKAAEARAFGTEATLRAAHAQDVASASTKRLNGFVQQAGYQVSDAANQIATGTNAFTVFGMQAGQLLGTLGPVGAAIGAVVNVAGVAAGVIQKQAEAAAEAARATDLLTVAQRASLEITETSTEKARRLRDERNEQAAATHYAALSERELADAMAVSALMASQAAMEKTKLSNELYLAQGPGRFLGPAELSRMEFERKAYEAASKAATETSKRLNEAQENYERFRGNLKKTGGFSGEEVDKLRERIDGIVSSYDDATLRTVTLRQKQEELAEAVKANIITQAQADDILQKYTKHLDENSAAAKEAEKAARAREKAEEKLEKQILAAVKAADAKAVEEYNKVIGEGKRVYESTRTPAEKYADELTNLRRLLDYGAINQDTFNRAVQAADPAFQEAQKAAERYAQEVNRVAEDIAKDWSETLYDAIILRDKQTSIVDAFRDLFKRIAIEAIKANIVLPITQQIVGAAPSLFGIQSPSSAANQNGGMGGMGGQALSLGSKFMPSSWTSGITGAIDQFGASALGIGSSIVPAVGGQAATVAATTINPATGSLAAYNSWGAAGAQGASAGLSSYLGPLGAGFAAGGLIGPMLANGNKAVGGLAGAASGAAAGALVGSIIPGVGTLVGAIIGGAGGGLGGLIGTQKPSVGKTASADVTVNSGGRSATYGNILTDNEGDAEAGKALGQYISTIFTTAAAGGGTLAKSFGFGQTAKDGYYIAGSVDYKKFGDDFAGMIRYALLDQGGLQGGGVNTLAALRNSTNKDAEEFGKDIALGASIDAGNTALWEMVKTLGGVTDAAKKATTESFAPMFEELERAKKLGIDGAYKALATDQLKAYLDQLRNPPNFTQTEQDMAALKGQFQATREAYAQLNPEMVTYVDQIERETRARMAANLNKGLDQQINEASGRGYLNQIGGFLTTLDENARSLAAVGEPATRANNLFNASLGGLLKTLTTDQLTDVVRTFGGDIGRLAQQIGAANDNVQQATRFEALLSQIRQENIQTEIGALNEQKSAAQSTKTAWENLQKSAKGAVSSLLVSDYSTLSPEAKLREAVRQFDDLIAKAATGDVDAGAQAVSMRDTVLSLARGFHASSEGYVSIFNHVSQGLTGVESVASRQVSLASQQVSRLDTQISIQQGMLKELQNRLSPEDVTALVSGMNSGNAGDISAWAKTQGPGLESQIKRGRLEALGNADIERLFGGFSDIQAARSSDPSFNLAAWFKAYGISEVLAGTRSIPGFATGTDSAPPGMAWVGEQGRELVQMAGGERVYPHSVSMDIARSWGVANDRWAGVAEFRRPAASGGGNADLIQRMERQIALLEEQNQLLRQGNSTAGAVGDRVVSRLDGVKDEVRGSAARAEFTKKKVA